ncbi:MAG TPA: M14 family metallopeptidase [Ilumatobacteraceae bacterium]|nr:M14 family metallopeptidase [Ilumatobacteraceae bacterium]
MTAMPEYGFDRYLRYDELTAWLNGVAAANPGLVTVEQYGTSFEGRPLWLVTVTDRETGDHATKPAHWVDASIHAVELTATVAACHLVDYLVRGHAAGDPTVVEALRTRTFYVVPRVNPDGAERVLADRPTFRRSSVRPWPWADGVRLPGLHAEDIDGDGRILDMRIADADGAWMPHPDDGRLLIPVPAEGASPDTSRYRLLREGTVEDHDNFTIPKPRPPEALDLNRNFPAGWGPGVPGSGDHPLSEPEIDALVRAIIARPNVCGYNAYHTSGGWILRPSSMAADSTLPPGDLWTWKQLAERGTALTGYTSHSIFEDFTWDPSDTMSGAADDWVYEHLGIYGWTTEYWDVVKAATGHKQSTHFWYHGPTDDESLAVLRWCDEHHPDGHVDWYPFEHPQLGAVELGGWNTLTVWYNPPPELLRSEVAPHAEFAVYQALCSPRLEIRRTSVARLGGDTWRVEVGVANTGWLPTDVSKRARKEKLVKPILVELTGDGVEVLDKPARREVGQLEGRAAMRFTLRNDGTPDRVLVAWTLTAQEGAQVKIVAKHDRSGQVSVTCPIE